MYTKINLINNQNQLITMSSDQNKEIRKRVLGKGASQVSAENAKPCRHITLKPAGYPLRLSEEEILPSITSDDPRLFANYAKAQWLGVVVARGDFIFDYMMFPDFAFLVTDIYPNPSKFTEKTIVHLKSYKNSETVNNTKKLIPYNPIVTFDDVIGQKEAKEKCSIIKHFLSNPTLYQSQWMPRNVLFHGPPGTGKTMMARALASAIKEAKLYIIKANDLIGVYVGEGSKKIKNLYSEARKNAPSIVFLDEIDSIALKRGYQSIRGDVIEIVSSLLSELDGIENNTGVITIASTNLIDQIDEAIISRFEQMIQFNLPLSNEREKIIEKNIENSPIKFTINIKQILSATKGWSGRDIVNKLIKSSIHKAIIAKKETINTNDLLELIDYVTRNEDLPHYT